MNKRKMAKLYVKISPEKLSITDAIEEITEVLETIKEAIALDGEVRFLKRGAFEILTRQPRVVSNPVTRERMTVYPKKNSEVQSVKENEIIL